MSLPIIDGNGSKPAADNIVAAKSMFKNKMIFIGPRSSSSSKSASAAVDCSVSNISLLCCSRSFFLFHASFAPGVSMIHPLGTFV
eukprot:CCRYP_005468-RE/>CCRYP_005468-RE protein AED:0.48 eAED:1.00 QI:0/0/0/1/0/0/2/0/84